MAAKMKVEITLIEDILGTLPGDPEIYKSYIASKAPDAGTIEDEVAAIGVDQVYDNKITVFPRDPQGHICIYDYLIRGFFKNAASSMAKVPGSKSGQIKAFKKRVDNHVFVFPRLIQIAEDNSSITICERPLRASTAQGERVAISAAESIPAGTSFEIEILCLIADDVEMVKEWLDYGALNGLGQWHNSGKGRFTWELLDLNVDPEPEKPAKKAGRKKKADEADAEAEAESE